MSWKKASIWYYTLLRHEPLCLSNSFIRHILFLLQKSVLRILTVKRIWLKVMFREIIQINKSIEKRYCSIYLPWKFTSKMPQTSPLKCNDEWITGNIALSSGLHCAYIPILNLYMTILIFPCANQNKYIYIHSSFYNHLNIFEFCFDNEGRLHQYFNILWKNGHINTVCTNIEKKSKDNKINYCKH